jgi:hypothetical protein
LRTVGRHLAKLADRTGHDIVLAIEPEPGCVLDTAPDVIDFFEHYLFVGGDVELLRRHITVCHDICHSAVMFEPQSYALEQYAQHGIRVGKLQVSSAVEVPWHTVAHDSSAYEALTAQLRSFSEPRYLHQTTRRLAGTEGVEIVDDLPIALEHWLPSFGDSRLDGLGQPWRIHFHVPIYVERFGMLTTTRDDIAQVVQALRTHSQLKIADRPWFTGDYEVETYAWGVLPVELRTI